MPRLTCDISQSLWDALHAAARESGESVAHLVSRALADTLQVDHGTLFQVSTSGALVEGVFDGVVPSTLCGSTGISASAPSWIWMAR